MKKFVIIAFALLAAGSATAQNKFSFGVSARMNTAFNEHVALSLDNVKFKDSAAPDKVMAYSVVLNFDYAITPVWTLGAAVGLNDLPYDTTLPLYLEAKRFFNYDSDRSRWFTYADLGTNIAVNEGGFGLQCGAGAGYRFHLARRCKLDLTLGYNLTQTHYPELTIIGADIEINDTPYSTAKTNVMRHSVSFGIAISF